LSITRTLTPRLLGGDHGGQQRRVGEQEHLDAQRSISGGDGIDKGLPVSSGRTIRERCMRTFRLDLDRYVDRMPQERPSSSLCRFHVPSHSCPRNRIPTRQDDATVKHSSPPDLSRDIASRLPTGVNRSPLKSGPSGTGGDPRKKTMCHVGQL
jgi:hypothetical protein